MHSPRPTVRAPQPSSHIVGLALERCLLCQGAPLMRSNPTPQPELFAARQASSKHSRASSAISGHRLLRHSARPASALWRRSGKKRASVCSGSRSLQAASLAQAGGQKRLYGHGRLSSKERCEYHDTKLVHQGLKRMFEDSSGVHRRTLWRSGGMAADPWRPPCPRPPPDRRLLGGSPAHWQCRRKPLGGIDNGGCQPGSRAWYRERSRPYLRGCASQSVPCWLVIADGLSGRWRSRGRGWSRPSP